MAPQALLNGSPAAADCLEDRACRYGDGLFETLAVVEGQPCLWQRHMDRLRAGCSRLGLAMPDPELLRHEARRLCGDTPKGVLRMLVSAGRDRGGYARDPAAGPTRWLRCSPWPDAPPWNDERPLRAQLCETRLADQPLLAGIKHLNRLEQVLARAELQEGMHEGVLRNQRGEVVEGISANLLVRCRDGRWITPPLTDCGVEGTVRQHLLSLGPSLGLDVKVEPLSLSTLLEAEALFFSNALLGVRAAASVDEHTFPETGRTAELEALHRACFSHTGEL